MPKFWQVIWWLITDSENIFTTMIFESFASLQNVFPEETPNGLTVFNWIKEKEGKDHRPLVHGKPWYQSAWNCRGVLWKEMNYCIVLTSIKWKKDIEENTKDIWPKYDFSPQWLKQTY